MNKKLFLIGAFSLIFSLTACANNGQNSSSNENTMMEVEMSEALSTEEAAKYTSDLPLEEKITLSKDLASRMPKDSLNQIESLFPDLNKTKKVATEDPSNLMKVGLETWYYTEEGNITIVFLDSAKSPIYVFEGSEISQEQINEAAKNINEGTRGNMELDETNSEESTNNETSNAENNGTISAGEITFTSASYKTEEPIYEDFSQTRYEELKGKKPLVLFFQADWSETAKQIEEDITEELSNFPKGTKILKTDFITENTLKKEFDIIADSTLVVLDSEGTVVKKLAEPSNKEIITTINNSL